MGAGLTWKSQHNYTCNSVAHSHHNLPALPPTLLTRDQTFTALYAVLLLLKVLFIVAKYGKGVLTSQSLYQVFSIEQRLAKFILIRTLQKSEPYVEGVWSPAKTNT